MVSVALKGVHESIRHFARFHFIGAKDLAHFDHLRHHETHCTPTTPAPIYRNGSIQQAIRYVLLKRVPKRVGLDGYPNSLFIITIWKCPIVITNLISEG